MNTLAIRRVSPVSFSTRPSEVEERQGWRVVLAYEGEGGGPFLVDLSHFPKWDLQDACLDDRHPWDLTMPHYPGQSWVRDGWLVNRLNRTQAQAWRIDGAEVQTPEQTLDQTWATDITDGRCLLAVVGQNVPVIMEALTPLDVFSPKQSAPCLIQGPVLHLPCQIVRMGPLGDHQVVLLAFSRGYGQTMAEAILAAGSPHGLKPGGERVFTRLLGAQIFRRQAPRS